MLAGIDALIALQRYGTVSEAAVRLRLTQSAVSKRIKTLTDALGFELVEPDGRRIRLTSQAVSFLERARPLVAELRGLRTPAPGASMSNFSLALADSIASSWGPRVVRRALGSLRGVAIDLHAHRSVLVIEYVRLGRYHIGLCTDPVAAKDLIHHPLIDEPIVLMHAGARPKSAPQLPLISIESTSAAWKAIEPLLRQHHRQLLQRQLIPVESFSAAMQMVEAGFGDGLIPLGLILEKGLRRRGYSELTAVHRPVSLLTRKTIDQLASFDLLRQQLVKATEAYFATARKA
jgi:DNA-binding transcriptional LysR family regulator